MILIDIIINLAVNIYIFYQFDHDWTNFARNMCKFINVETKFVKYFYNQDQVDKICIYQELNLLLYYSKLCMIDVIH